MSKSSGKWIVTGVCLAAAGLITFAAAMTACSWDFNELSTDRFETNTHVINEEFSDIGLNTETADITFAVSDDGICRVVCYEDRKQKHSASVHDGTLTVSVADERKWYEHIGIGFHSPEITVYLPGTEYASLVIKESTGDITLPGDFTFGSIDIALSTGGVSVSACSDGPMRIKSSTGDISLQDLSAGELDLSVSTGHVDVRSVACEGNIGIRVSTGAAKLTDVTCKNVNSDGSTGDITLKNTVAEEKIAVERSTGDVRFDGCDAGELEIETDTGSVTGSLLSSKVFITHSDTGKISVPETVSGGKCRISTDTGDIRITLN